MVGSVVVRDELQGVPGESVTAVVVDGLDGGKGKEGHALSDGHTGELEGYGSADGVEEEALEGMVVESAIGVGDVETVVARVESSFLTLVNVAN